MISQLTSEQKENAKKVLKKALALIRKGWTKGALAIDKDKIPLLPELAVKREGCKFCSVGAIEGAAELTCLLQWSIHFRNCATQTNWCKINYRLE